jgi:N-acetylglucosaminyldiphosphoundecaprenol N-acetyl-beta-D-mannosaminyltransferase
MNRDAAAAERINVLGVAVSVIDLPTATRAIIEAASERRKGYVCVTGVHGLIEAQDDDQFRRILNDAYLVTPDGMPLVWVGKLLGKWQIDRVYGPDLMLAVLEASQGAGVRHFLYGGASGAAEELRRRMTARFPALQICGVYEPPFRPLNASEEADLRDRVRQSRADIIWVGLSTPKQERFMAEYLGSLDTTLMIGVGAAFDFHSGRLRQAPRWMQRSGLEWAYRLYREPRRLWRRYSRNNPRFLWRILLQLTGVRRYPLD